MIRSIAVLELYNNLISSRFMIGFLLCLVLIPFSIIVGIQEYQTRVDIYEVEKNQADESTQVRVWSAYKPEVVKPPEPLSIFSRGISGNVGNRVKVYLEVVPMLASGRVSVRDNPFLNSIFTLDFASMFALLMSLLALVFSYDICTGEKEEGTLKLMLTNPVSRSAVLIGKGLGILMTLIPIMLFSFVLSALIILLYPGLSYSAMDWTRIGVLALISVVFFAVFVGIGMFVSSRSRSSAASIVICLFIWVVFVFIIPNGAVYAARTFVNVRSQENLQYALDEIEREMYEQIDRQTSTISREGLLEAIFALGSGGYDGYFEMRGAAGNYHEYYRQRYEIETPIRMEYSNKKWPLQQAYLEELHSQAATAYVLGMISPVQLFRQAADALCRTDINTHDSFMQTVRRYREAVLDYFNDKKLYSQYLWTTPLDPKTFMSADELIEYTTDGFLHTLAEFHSWFETSEDPMSVLVRDDPNWEDPGTIVDDSDAPRFGWHPDSLSASLGKSFIGIGGMMCSVLVLLLLSFVSFSRFDVR